MATSAEIGQSMKAVFGDKCRVIKIDTAHYDKIHAIVQRYVMEIEEAHKRAASSTLVFK